MKRGNHRKFGREKNLRNALYESLATALIAHGKIKTTQAKAKSLVRYVARLVTLAKKQNLNSRRLLLTEVGEASVSKLMNEIAKQFAERNGGYTKITRLGQRKSDGAEMAIVQWSA